MDEKECTKLLEHLFPVGKERWIKVRYMDFRWCLEHLHPNGLKKSDLGFVVTSVSVRDEFSPQLSALQDVKEAIIGLLYSKVPETLLETVNNIFTAKMDIVSESFSKDAESLKKDDLG